MRKPKNSSTKISPKTKQKQAIRFIIVGASALVLIIGTFAYLNFKSTRSKGANVASTYKQSYRSTDINIAAPLLRDATSMKRTDFNNPNRIRASRKNEALLINNK